MATGLARATIDDLYKVDGKAELINGEIIYLMSTGSRPNIVALNICVALRAYSRQVGRGVTYSDGAGFYVPELASGRESFSPDAAYYTGPPPAGPDDFLPAAPAFAVEVRSRGDTGPAAELDMAAKRADYFAAGTLVVWDVDPAAGVVRKYTPAEVTAFAAGEVADAEPAVPGWRVRVDDVFA